MGAYNILKVNIECEHCHSEYSTQIQFKFGDTWQHEYKPGDRLCWGGNDVGKPNLKKVKIYGIAEDNDCPLCFHQAVKEYDITVEKDIIKKVMRLSDISAYDNDIHYLTIE